MAFKKTKDAGDREHPHDKDHDRGKHPSAIGECLRQKQNTAAYKAFDDGQHKLSFFCAVATRNVSLRESPGEKDAVCTYHA